MKWNALPDFQGPPGHVWGRAEQEYPTRIDPPNLVEQAASQQTEKKDLDFVRSDFGCGWHLQALARGENIDKLITLSLPPAADRDGEEEEEGGDDGEDDGDDHGAQASPPQADQLGAHLAEGADIHLVVRGQLGLVWFAWKVADETKE